MFPVTDHAVKTARHTSFYLSCGAGNAPLIVFVHGWPELSVSWRHQLPCFAALGFRAIAPDMRGYGRSTVHPRQADYALEHIAADMIELLDSLGREKAIWVGHDWGSPVVWSIASHHPDRCHGVANLCVPYFPKGFGPRAVAELIDRSVYPEAEFPAGQWEYQLFYRENFDKAHTVFEANVPATVKALFRKGDPAGKGKPSRTAFVRKDGGWFGGRPAAPDLPLDVDVLTEADMNVYAAALTRNGFSGPDSWYMNPEVNAVYAEASVNNGRIDMPVLFLHGEYDYTCETITSRLAEPMRAGCPDLTEAVVPTGHWMAQENPVAVNAHLARWIAAKLPEVWPVQGSEP
ncbi:MAG: alpha/beta hydrolase [Acetobacteraceae bacterium]|nr:alpha/beta hydrolase [Acetobacteraceae bacterium]